MIAFILAALALLVLALVLSDRLNRHKRAYQRSENYRLVRDAVLTQRGLARLPDKEA